MGRFLTSASATKQLPEKGMYCLINNELYLDDDGSIYLAWRGFKTDQFTWIAKANWDTRCAHIHDVGCKYHQVVKVKLSEKELLREGYLRYINKNIICRNLPEHILEVKDVSGTWINNLFYRMLRDADCPKTPKYIQLLYRAGVSFNIGWFSCGKEKIDIKNLYE